MKSFLRTPRRWNLPGGINIAWHEPLGVPGSPYLIRWMIEWRPLGSIRLHHWLGSDDHHAPHDHSWGFATLVLRGRIPCPGHARHPNMVHGVRTGDLVQVRGQRGWVQGRAQVEAGRGRVTAKNRTRTASSSHHVRRLAPGNGYTESN